MRIAFLHIGPHKTGSTSIQTALAKNLKVLEDANFELNEVIYKSPFRDKRFNLAHPLLGADRPPQAFETRVNLIPSGELKGFQESYWNRLNASLALSEKNLIITHEALLHGFSESSCEKLRDILSIHFDKIQIITYLRDPFKILNSWISEDIKHKGDTHIMSPEEAYRRHGRGVRYYNSLRKWEDIFGRNNLIIKKFSRETLKNASVVDDFFYQIGIKSFSNVKNTNESLSKGALELLAALNYYLPNNKNVEGREVVHRVIIPLIQAIDNCNEKFQGKMRYSEDTVEEIFQDMQTWGIRYFNESNPFGLEKEEFVGYPV